MDDHSFDRFVRNKLSGYEDAAYHASSFSDLEQRLDSWKKASGFRHYGTKVLWVALVASTLLNIFLLLQYSSSGNAVPNLQVQINALQRGMDSLTLMVHGLHEQNVAMSHRLDSAAEASKLAIDQTIAFRNSGFTPPSQSDGSFLSKDTASTASGLLQMLVEKNLVTITDGKIYLREQPDQQTNVSSVIYLKPFDLHSEGPTFIHPMPARVKNASSPAERSISAKTRNKIEKHYFNGLGINVAPHADLSASMITQGKGLVTPRLGVSADWILSPKFSIETSLDYSTIRYCPSDNYWNHYGSASGYYGTLTDVLSTTKLLSSPVGVRLRQWISYRDQFFIKAGYTPYFMIGNKTDLTYGRNSSGDPDDDHFTQTRHSDEKRYYASTGSLAVGFTRSLDKKRKVELSLFYEHSLQNARHEDPQFQLAGIRTAYWFSVQ